MATIEDHVPFFASSMLLLVVAGIVVPLCQRIKLSPVITYLLSGFVVGPFGLVLLAHQAGLSNFSVFFPSQKQVKELAELGIIFLMFMIGLDLSPSRLWALRSYVLGLGSLQFLITSAIIGLCAFFFGNTLASAVILGCALALSSTAVVMQLLSDRHDVGSPLGRVSFAVLLFQDLAVVPVLVLAGALTESNANLFYLIVLAAFKALIAVGFIFVFGRKVLRPLFRLASFSMGSEAFFAVVLMVALGTAALTGISGLSMALGAFLAGLLLAETEFSAQIQTYLSPFKGLLLGIFFMSIGMGLDIRMVIGNFDWLMLSLLGMIAIKGSIHAALCRFYGFKAGFSIEAGFLLSQSGEFAFIIIGVAMTTGLITVANGQFMIILTVLSMLITPFLAFGARWTARKLDDVPASSQMSTTISSQFHALAPPPTQLERTGHIIIAGFGRVGRVMAEMMEASQIPWIALDTDIQTVTRARQKNLPVWYGDARQSALLEALHVEHAQALVVTVTTTRLTEEIIMATHPRWPLLSIYVRAKDRSHARYLRKFGSIEVVPENLELALQLSAQVLRDFKVDEKAIQSQITVLREASLAEPPDDKNN